MEIASKLPISDHWTIVLAPLSSEACFPSLTVLYYYFNLTKLFWGFVWPSTPPWFGHGSAWKLHEMIGNWCENDLTWFLFWKRLYPWTFNFVCGFILFPQKLCTAITGHQGWHPFLRDSLLRHSRCTWLAPKLLTSPLENPLICGNFGAIRVTVTSRFWCQIWKQ